MKKKILIILCAVLISLITIVSLKTLYDNSREEGMKVRSFLKNYNVFVTEGEHCNLDDEYGYYARTEKITKNITKTFIYGFKSDLEFDPKFNIYHTVIPLFQGEYITKGFKTYLFKKTDYLMANYSCEYNLSNVDAPNVGDVDYDVNKDFGIAFEFMYTPNGNEISYSDRIEKQIEHFGHIVKSTNVLISDKCYDLNYKLLTRLEICYKSYDSHSGSVPKSSITQMNYDLRFNLVTKSKTKVLATFIEEKLFAVIQKNSDSTVVLH